MNWSRAILLSVLLAAPGSSAASRSEAAAQGLGVNLSIVGRLLGGGSTLFITSVDIANNTAAASQVDFYFDATDLTTQQNIIIDGSITDEGLAAAGTGTVRGYANIHFDDFVDALVEAGMMTAETRDHGVLGSLLLVFDGKTKRGEGSASARFENDFGGGTVGVALSGHTITSNEPQELVATVRDTRGRPGPQLYTNMFINNVGLTPATGTAAGSVTVELTARANSSGMPVGIPIMLTGIAPGQTRSVSQVLTAMQVSASSEDTILVFARVTEGNAAIAGAVSIVDATTRDGSVVEMGRADF
ncbi:MAG: hypothetical protein ACSLFQ_08235 [Thermoanaerobaculia bacterium]